MKHEWVSVDDRFPEIAKIDSFCIPEDEAPLSSQRLLVFDEDEGEQYIAIFTQADKPGEEAYWMEWSSGATLYGVTHWRMLPDDPASQPVAMVHPGIGSMRDVLQGRGLGEGRRRS